MIITKTPFRMSFFGGGTDFPEFFERRRGAVLSTTIDKYCYVTVRHLPRFFDYQNELAYSRIERVASPEEFEHPLVRNAMRMLDMSEVRIGYEADLPARSGLGTSSAFAVGLLNAFHCLKGAYVSKRDLATEAIHLERDLCNEAGGWQDQVAAAFGGFNKISFQDNQFQVSPLIISSARKLELNRNLMLYFTGFTRDSSRTQSRNKVTDQEARLVETLQLVEEAERVLTDDGTPLRQVGELLDHAWSLKRRMGSRVSNAAIDSLYESAKSAGALGGKILGAGNGGFMLFFVEPENQASVSSALSSTLRVPFEFEESGASVVYYDPEEDRRGSWR